jgi:hypothetical protein
VNKPYLPHEAWIDGVQMTPEQMAETRRRRRRRMTFN